MIKKIFQAIKPKYVLDYIFIFAIFWNFSPLIILTFFDLVGTENKIIQTLTTVTTFHYWLLIPKDAGLEALSYFISIPIAIAVFINLLAFIIKSTIGKIKYSSIIGITLVFALLSLLILLTSATIGSIKYNHLRKERETIGKEMIISLEGCDLYQEPDNKKQIKCRFTLSNVPPIATEKPIIEIIMRSDLNPINRVSLYEPVKLARTGNDTFEGDFIITKLSGEEFSSIYISLFELIDGFKRYPSEDLKLYLIQ